MSLIQFKDSVNLTEILLKWRAGTPPYTKQFWAFSVQDWAVCWHSGDLFSWWYQAPYFPYWSQQTAKPAPSLALAPTGCRKDSRTVRRLEGGDNDISIWKAKAVCPGRVEKGTDLLLPIGKQVSSHLLESWASAYPAVAQELEYKCHSHKYPLFLLFLPSFYH